MRFLLGLAISLGVALLVGVGSAVWVVRSNLESSWLQNGPWVTNPVIGSPAADPYTRARVAVAGLLALNKRETIYFVANTDDAGTPLTTGCRYRVVGSALPARWWSITAYGGDHYLIPNPHDRYSYDKNTVTYDAAGGYAIWLAQEPQSNNWIPLGSGSPQPFSLILRLYNPSAAAADVTALTLPRIRKEGCS